MSRKTVPSITLPFDLSCCGFFFLGDDGDFRVADCCLSCRSYRKHHVSAPVMIRLRNVPSLSALLIRSPQMLMRLSHWSCVRTCGTLCCNTRHVQVMRQNFMASTIANPCCCCDFIYHLGAVDMHQCCNFLDLEFSSDCSWLCSSSSKLSLPCGKSLCHLNTTLWPKASPYACLSSEMFC
jgi:hypothetical protein